MEQVTVIKVSPDELKKIIVEAVNKALGEYKKQEQKTAQQPEQEIINVKVLCERYHFKKNTVYAWAEQGLIPHMKGRRLLFFNVNEINNWLAAGRRKTRAEIEEEAEQYFLNNSYGRK